MVTEITQNTEIAAVRAWLDYTDTLKAWEAKYGKQAPNKMYNQMFKLEDVVKSFSNGSLL